MKCINCKGELRFDPQKQKLICDYCGSEFDAEKYNAKENNAKEAKKIDETVKAKSYTCTRCGATLLTFDDTVVTFCSYCDSSMTLNKKLEEISPEYIIPFSKTKEECIKEYKNKLSKSLFVPNYMKSDMTISKFRGIFMPYEIYEIGYTGEISCDGEKYIGRHGDYQIYKKYNIKSNLDSNYDGLSKDVSAKYYDKFSESIPFDFTQAIKFKKEYLSGFYADSKDVSEDIYTKEIENICISDIKNKISNNNEFKKHGCTSPNVPLKTISKKTGLFPVYFLAIKNKDNEHVHYAVINGQTGKVAIDLPLDFKKYIIFSLVLSTVLFIIMNITVTPSANMVIILGLIFSIISFLISSIQLNKIYKHNNHLDDKGVQYINKDKKNKQVSKERTKYLYKQIISIITCIIILILNPVNDYIFYIGAFISFILTILSFKDLIKERNLLSSEKLPQLEKRGGDENA